MVIRKLIPSSNYNQIGESKRTLPVGLGSLVRTQEGSEVLNYGKNKVYQRKKCIIPQERDSKAGKSALEME